MNNLGRIVDKTRRNRIGENLKESSIWCVRNSAEEIILRNHKKNYVEVKIVIRNYSPSASGSYLQGSLTIYRCLTLLSLRVLGMVKPCASFPPHL